MSRQPWHKAAPAPVVLITGPGEYLGSRAVNQVQSVAMAKNPDLDVVHLDAHDYDAGDLLRATSPSLFSTEIMVVASRVHQCSDAFLDDALAYLESPEEDTLLVLWHGGGNRARKLLTTAEKKRGSAVFEAPDLKREADKAAFIAAEFRRTKRRVEQEATRVLLDAVGSDVRDMAAACAQLDADVPQGRPITVQDVNTYYGGRVEATGFKVADAVIARDAGEALSMFRQATATGVNVVPIVAAIAARIRQLIKVGAAGGGRGSAADLGMPPWLVDKARRDLRAWTPQELGSALVALADADEDTKGRAADPIYAVERLIVSMCTAAPAGSRVKGR